MCFTGCATSPERLAGRESAAHYSAMGEKPAPSLSIVMIEDNSDTAELLSLALQRHGHRVTSASDGNAGLRLIATCAPDVVLSDIALPGDIDGFQVARTLMQKHKAGARRPFLVACSGFASDLDKQRATAAGFDAHFSKPVDAVALVALLSTLA
jgi:CheY-like chemotaxis protein